MHEFFHAHGFSHAHEFSHARILSPRQTERRGLSVHFEAIETPIQAGDMKVEDPNPSYKFQGTLAEGGRKKGQQQPTSLYVKKHPLAGFHE